MGAAPTDYATGTHFGLPVECLFEILRVDVQPGSRNDHVAFAPLEIKIAGIVHCANVAGVKPLPGVSIHATGWRPITGRYALAAHDDFARLVEFHFITGHQFADRTM